MKHIGIVVCACPVIGLGCRVIALFKGVDKNVNERIYHENTQKQDCRQKIEPAF